MKPRLRDLLIDGDVAYVPLTRGYVATIDAADAPLVEGYNWCAQLSPISRTTYAMRKEWLGNGKERTLYLHRALLGVTDPSIHVDHLDLDGLNNRKTNLRECSAAQNQHNTRMQSNNKSGFKGVCWQKDVKKWRAQITVFGSERYLGIFSTAEDAHAAYVKAAEKYHGNFARLA